MNDIWSILGIEPTDDKKAIRRAFAAQIRIHHPEEEPAYFEALNQAYKAALDYGTGAGKDVFAIVKEAQNKEFRQKSGEEEVLREKTEQEARSKEQGHEDTGKEDSLLDRLGEAEERAIQRSMETGALHDLIVLFENGKQAKQADTWKRFFLSEAFLEEQFSEEFGKGLLAYLSKQTLHPHDNLPMGFLQELAIAYAFIPHFAGEEYFEGLEYPKEWYKVSVENTFPGRRYAAEIFNMQGRESDLKSMTGRMLRQPANKVRHNAFSDYLAMKEMSRDGRLTDREKERWQQVLGLCQPYYLFERNGKQRGSGAYESRSECVVKLYVRWLKDERLPKEVLLFLYKKLDLKTLERSSTRGLYAPLKEEVLRQLPQAEDILFGEEGTEQRITKLYRIYSTIINDNQNNYDKFIYEETPEIRERAEAFFALPDWEQLKGEKGLFERIYSVSKRIVMPKTLAQTLIGYLEAGDHPEPERTELIESLLRSLSTGKMCRELDYRHEISFSSVNPEDIGENPDFWQYFLMRGFGFRHTGIRGNWEKDYIYVMDGERYLPAYIHYLYAPSKAWQRRFVGFDEEKEEIGVPVSVVCPMPEGRKLRVEFHYHYCLYFVEDLAGEEQVTAPVLTFSQLRESMGKCKKPEEFFFLLAVTAIEDFERGAAKELIETWLRKIPIYPFIISTVAEMLAADNDRIPGAAVNSKTVLYEEQERFCFRALVSEKGFSIWQQMDYSWQDIIFRSVKLGFRKWEEYTWEEYGLLCKEQTQTAAFSMLRSLRQPKPVMRAAYSLEGMSVPQKAAKILEVMGYLENMEGYCVLRYGEKRKKRHDRLFYGALAPFGFDLETHSQAHARSRDYLMASSNTKIKEPKILVGRFGWGFKYSPMSDYGPMYVYQGESGKFYAYGSIRMHRADSLEELLADFFKEEWEGATEVLGYEGCLTISKLDHRLEYCYTEEDMRQSMGDVADTVADRFTVFDGYGMWMELSRWLDGILRDGLPLWVNVIAVGFDWEREGALTFSGFYEEDEGPDELEETEEEETQKEPYCPLVPVLVWAKGMDRRNRIERLKRALQWYVECGKFAEKMGDRDIRILVRG